MMLALFLDRYGVRSVVFNSEPEVRRHPKGSTHNSRTMEHLPAARHRPRCASSACRDRPTDVSYFTLTGWELGRIPMPSEADKRRASPFRPRPTRPPSRCSAPTRCSRGVPAGRRADAAQHHLRFGWRVDRLQGGRRRRHGRGGNRDGGRRIGARNISPAATAGAASCAARWRSATAVWPRSDSPYYWAAAERDVFPRAHALSAITSRTGRPGSTGCASEGALHHPCLNDDEEFLISQSTRDGTADRRGAPRSSSRRRRGFRSRSLATSRGRLAWRWSPTLRAGRVVLAGDAAHLFTPTGGFGMNTGIDDAPIWPGSSRRWSRAGAGGLLLLRDRAQADRASQHHRGARASKQFGGVPG